MGSMGPYGAGAARAGGARWSRRRMFGAGAGAGMGALYLAACGGNNNSGSKSATSARATASGAAGTAVTGAATAATAARNASPTAGSSASPAAAQPRRGGTVTFATGADLANLDVHMSSNTFIVGWGPGAAWSQLVRS